LVIKRHNEQDIFIPQPLVDEWVKSYGVEDLSATIPQFANAIKIIETCRTAGVSESNDIRTIFHRYIRNSNFFTTDLGRYIQIAVLVGHEIDPNKYLGGSGAEWDTKSLMKLVDIALVEKGNSQGHQMIYAEVFYCGFSVRVVKNFKELQQLLY
jgi:hypothetical protein